MILNVYKCLIARSTLQCRPRCKTCLHWFPAATPQALCVGSGRSERLGDAATALLGKSMACCGQAGQKWDGIWCNDWTNDGFECAHVSSCFLFLVTSLHSEMTLRLLSWLWRFRMEKRGSSNMRLRFLLFPYLGKYKISKRTRRPFKIIQNWLLLIALPQLLWRSQNGPKWTSLGMVILPEPSVELHCAARGTEGPPPKQLSHVGSNDTPMDRSKMVLICFKTTQNLTAFSISMDLLFEQELILFLECQDVSVNLRLFRDAVARPEALRSATSSGAYRRGCCMLRLTDLEPQSYVLVVSTFRPGVPWKHWEGLFKMGDSKTRCCMFQCRDISRKKKTTGSFHILHLSRSVVHIDLPGMPPAVSLYHHSHIPS